MDSLTSGIRAGGSGEVFTKKIILKDAETSGPWKTKLTPILDAEDCYTIVDRSEVSPTLVMPIPGPDKTVTNQAQVSESRARLRDYQKRTRKATSLITQTIDDSIVMNLDVHNRDPRAIWDQLAQDYDNVTPSGRMTAEKAFLDFRVPRGAAYLQIKQSFNEQLRKVRVRGGNVSTAQQLQTLLGALPPKYDGLKEAFFARETQPTISFVWDRSFDIETTDKRRATQNSEAAAFSADIFYESRRGRGGGRGRGEGGRGEVPGKAIRNDNCFRCGAADHWSLQCPLKQSVCDWCGGTGHIEKTCFDKEKRSG